VGPPTVPIGRTSPHVFARDNISLRLMETDYRDVVQFHISP
jgi:hypothetical protein